MDYEKKYKTLVEAVKTLKEANPSDEGIQNWVNDNVPELAENEDERIRKEIISAVNLYCTSYCRGTKVREDMLAWLEKQEQKPLVEGTQKPTDKVKPKFKVGDKVFCALSNRFECTIESIDETTYYGDTTNFDIKDQDNWELVEQKPTDKVEPEFKVGDWVTDGHVIYQIQTINENDCLYGISDDIGTGNIPFDIIDDFFHLWSIQDAKDGDVLVKDIYPYGISICLLKEFNPQLFTMRLYCSINKKGQFLHNHCGYYDRYDVALCPATKEQRALLFQKMHEAGYTFDFKNKELKKIEDEEYNGEDYGIDSLFHAQRILEKTLGSVEGYQSDDGILEHKCAISAVKKLYEQKHTSITNEWIEDSSNIHQTL